MKKETGIAKPTKQKFSTQLSFPVVGIGASAGGLEALEQFFSGMPKDTGMAFVVIQHLDPTHVGIMPELLQRATEMKVLQVTDHLQMIPDHVYVIPPNKSMSILNGYLHLFEPTELRGLRLPIDIFFRSLADDQQGKSIGIILSGMGSDGSLGLKAIKEKNGIVAVQDPSGSKFTGMPNSALNAVPVDIIADAKDIPSKLISLLKYSPINAKEIVIDEKNNTSIEKIVILIRTHTGHDFSNYKKTTLLRRIERRMGIHQLGKIANYVRFLQENPGEVDILFKELLIGVTNFFRDVVVWDKLKEQVFPDLFKELPSGYVMRVWIAGCSTGEEAYSFAIVFREAFEKINKNLSLQIFATDIDKDAINIARKGVYSSNIVTDVSSERLSKFFTASETSYIVNASIREMIVFAPHDVIKDPPFTKLDFLSCRNLLIYMESDLQTKLMNLFYYSLNPGGLMLLGSAESINTKDELFNVIDKKYKLYKRSVKQFEVDRLEFPNTRSRIINLKQDSATPVKVTQNIQSFADQLLLQRFAPASVIINQDGEILYITGKTGKYLEPAAGKASMNIYAMARAGLRNVLLGAVRKAKHNYVPITIQNIRIEDNGNSQSVDVTIQSIDKPIEFRGTIIIVFKDVPVPPIPINKNSKTGKQVLNDHEHEIELELKRTFEELQNTREEMQTSQEELKSTNEELQSTNEELQSTNEELTTSKEEMQSLNEELQTVNIELQSKVADFMDANNDMKNLLNSTDIATLFIDKELNIRRFTDHMTKIIKLRDSDIGRPFTEVGSDLLYPEMADHAREVLRTLILKESDISTVDNRWYKVRIMPYRTMDDKIEGLVITFIDISTAKKLEFELNSTINILRENNLLK